MIYSNDVIGVRDPRPTLARAVGAAALGVLFAAHAALAQPATQPAADESAAPVAAAPAVEAAPAVPVPSFTVGYYGAEDRRLPASSRVLDGVTVRLAKNAAGAYEVRPNGTPYALKGAPAGDYTDQALRGIADAIVRFYNDAGFYAVQAGWTADQADPGRPPADPFKFTVVVPVVSGVRTLAMGGRIPADRRVNAAEHASIRENSPLSGTAAAAARPTTAPASGAARGDFLNKDELDQYVYRLNRHPGRRVDVAIAPGNDPETLSLDYLVSESRPWYAFFQLSNTGTENTSEWRERFGFTHNQLTGHDDILTLDYSTANFDESHSVNVAYDFPIAGIYKVRGRVYGSYNQFTASDVGFIEQEFDGDEWLGGAEVAFNVAQVNESFVDVIAGGRYQNVSIENSVGGQTVGDGEAGFVEPYVGVQFDRQTETASTLASLTLTYGATDADDDDLDALRIDSDDHFWLLQGTLGHSFFLEPIFDRRDFDAGASTLAHEVYVGVRGQYAFDYRLVPQIEDVAGGLYSVRGYEESETAGDSVLIGTVEYRYHIPRGLAVRPEPGRLFNQPFRYRPQTAYGRPDWDLIVRPFVDAARVWQSDRLPFESNNTLISTGLGLEFQYKNNFNARVDWGIALHDVEANGFTSAERGDNRFSFSFTFIY